MNQYVKNKLAQVSLLVILFISQAGFNFSRSSHHNDRLAEVWGTELLNSLKPNSILILCTAGQLPIYYQQLIKGLRPDVTLYDRNSSYTKDNLYGPGLLFERIDAIEYGKRREQQLINTSLRPVYYTCREEFIDKQNIKFSRTPFVYRVDKRHFEASDFTRFTVSDRLLDSLANGYPKSDFWIDRIRIWAFGRLIYYYGGHNRPEINSILDYFKRTRFYSDPQFLLSLANSMYYDKNDELAEKFFERAEELSLHEFSPRDLAIFCHILSKAKNYDKALGICIRQEQSSPPCEVNTVKTRQRIADIYKVEGNWPKVAEYSRKIIECQPNNKIAQGYLELATQRTR